MDVEYAGGLDENFRSLWKICRALSNPLRLELLRIVYTQQGDNCERQIVRMVAARQAIVSAYLNQLVAAGLVAVERDRIKVYFKPWPRHGAAEELCRVLKACYLEDPPEGWTTELVRLIRPFAHFNRLAMLGRLLLGPATKAELKACTGTIVKTFEHHLRIINAAGLLKMTYHGPKPMELQLVRDGNPLSEVLFMCLRHEIVMGADFRNIIADRGQDAATAWVLRSIRSYEGADWTSAPHLPPKRERVDDEIAAALDDINQD